MGAIVCCLSAQGCSRNIRQQSAVSRPHRTGKLGCNDGKNDWKNYENITIFGLPYLPKLSIILEIFSTQGERSNAWLHSNRDRPRNRLRTVQKISQGYTVSSIIQALNRCQIRKSINPKGVCPDTHIYCPSSNALRQIDV